MLVTMPHIDSLVIVPLMGRLHSSVASPGGSQGFLGISQAPAIAYSTVLSASYSFGATGNDQSP